MDKRLGIAIAGMAAALAAGAWLWRRYGPSTYLRFDTMFGKAKVYQVLDDDGSPVQLLEVDGIVQSGTYLDERYTELVFEPGVELLAKRGAYKALRDYLLELPYCTNVTIRGGAGSTLRMWKKDYQGPDYKHGEWRYALRIFHCRNVLVEGLTIVESGGDGIGVTGTDITIRNCVCDRNHRQGMSVFNVKNFLVENCVFSNTSGTPPQSGVDIEPDHSNERLENIVFRNCQSFGNAGAGFEAYLAQLRKSSGPVSILFENCRSWGNNGRDAGLVCTKILSEEPAEAVMEDPQEVDSWDNLSNALDNYGIVQIGGVVIKSEWGGETHITF